MKKIKLLINEDQNSYQNSKICYICTDIFDNKHATDKNIVMLRTIIIIQENIEVLHLV